MLNVDVLSSGKARARMAGKLVTQHPHKRAPKDVLEMRMSVGWSTERGPLSFV